jgi:hypothetical protein
MDSWFTNYKAASEYAKNLAKEGKNASVKRDGERWIVKAKSTCEEKKCAPREDHVWVGMFPNTGAIAVFDTSIKINGVENVYGYVPSRDVMRQFDPEQLKQAVRLLGTAKNIPLAKYYAWQQNNGTEFVTSERNRVESKIAKAIQKHKEYLKKIGKPYSGVNTTTSKRHRVTHCYACKVELDSTCHIECNECGWLICECGACGCGYGQ